MPINYVDTGFVLICTALVIFMTFGVGLFYAGLVHRKNIISMLTLSFISFALVSLQWIFFGYSLAFGPDFGGLIGTLDNVGLAGVTMDGENIPQLVFMMFQMAFAAITLAIEYGRLSFMIRWLIGCGVEDGHNRSAFWILPEE